MVITIMIVVSEYYFISFKIILIMVILISLEIYVVFLIAV